MSWGVSQLRSQQVKLRAVCESEVQRAASDAASGVEGLQLHWRQVRSPTCDLQYGSVTNHSIHWTRWCPFVLYPFFRSATGLRQLARGQSCASC